MGRASRSDDDDDWLSGTSNRSPSESPSGLAASPHSFGSQDLQRALDFASSQKPPPEHDGYDSRFEDLPVVPRPPDEEERPRKSLSEWLLSEVEGPSTSQMLSGAVPNPNDQNKH